jgi:hypothetical protein
MFPVTVSGYVPDKEIGEVPYASFVYHIFSEGKNIRFLVWNSYTKEWDTVGQQFIKPMSTAPQDVNSNTKMRDYGDLLRKRQQEQGNV